MSTSPSKPLDFTAQIGVLGKGKCKANLKCPPHIAVPFPAVFYSYPTSGAGRSISDDNPSPYVGLIDLENAISQSTARQERKKRSYEHLPTENKDSRVLAASSNESGQPRKREKRSSRSEGLKTPPGGSYRIPQRGQLQIVIKNPNKTAVKLFLVPYDLDGMEPGSKTFIRQRSYSAGPIIDMPLTARKNFGTDRPEASLNFTDDPKDKPTLRYLIHLNICCTSKGRFYLYSTIRVVFANRVPDGKEKLRNEIQYPEPRYSPYRPVKDLSNANSRQPAENSFRRRSTLAGLPDSQFHDSNNNHHLPPHTTSPYSKQSPPAPPTSTMATLPFKLSTPKPRRTSLIHDAGSSTTTTFGSPWQEQPTLPADDPFHHKTPSPFSGRSSSSSSIAPESTTLPPRSPTSLQQHDADADADADTDAKNDSELYNKLQKGDVGYGGFFGSLVEPSSESGESLLAQKLKDWTCNK
jgi:hypothetical protein